MHEAVLFRQDQGTKIVCTACRRYCRLSDGQTGFCSVRINSGGRLFLANYGMILARQIDPIEKKPVLHAHPNSLIYSIGTSGCDFACRFCQNYDISQRKKPEGFHMDADSIVSEAVSYGCSGIAFTYNEPTIFAEFAHDVSDAAHRNGLFTIYVTNGYETEESVDYISRFIDYATVDFKGNADLEFYRKYMSVPFPDLIFDTIAALIERGVHVEITDLVIPIVGDSLEALSAMLDHLQEVAGNKIPISFLRFHPDYRMLDIPVTPIETLSRHYDVAHKAGFLYVYIGNVAGERRQNTYCPNCGFLLIERDMMKTRAINVQPDGICPVCSYQTDLHIT